MADIQSTPDQSRRPFTDLTGRKFGRWEVLSLNCKGPAWKWNCRCECGTEATVASENLKSGASSQCRPCGYQDVSAKKRKLSPVAVAEMSQAYRDGEKTAALAARYGIDHLTVTRSLHAEGIELRPWRGELRRYAHDEAAFDVMTPEALYWAGLLLADGCITGTGCVKIQLSGDDGAHLECFRDFLKAEQPLRQYPSRDRKDGITNAPTAYLGVSSPRLVKALARYGVTPRKSLTADPPDEVCGSPAFWRGVVDGDGCLSRHSGKYPAIHLCGSRTTCEKFRLFCLTLSPACRANPGPSQGVFQFRTCGRHAIPIIRALYRDGAVALPRKKALADLLLADRPTSSPGQPS